MMRVWPRSPTPEHHANSGHRSRREISPGEHAVPADVQRVRSVEPHHINAALENVHMGLDVLLVDPDYTEAALIGIARRLHLAMEAKGLDIRTDMNMASVRR